MRNIASMVVLMCCSTFLVAEEFAPPFPFVVSYDAPKNAVNVSSLLDAPAGKHGFVRVKDGKFVTDAGEIRFWATNLSGGANFPEKGSADKLADRLARFGFNGVRLHWMDGGNYFWGKNPTSLRKIDPEALDKLDYLVAALKKRGIYVNVNLHVARWLDDRDGFPHRDKRPKYDKGVDNFDPRMIELQKEYARDLLTHKNPYTGLSLAEDPAVAMVEINNENSVVIEWANGNLDDLPDPYGTEFRKQWNDWLKRKYESTAEMLTAWNCKNYPLGDEIIPGGDFTKPIDIDGKTWFFQLDDKEQATATVIPDEKLLRLDVKRNGKVAWTPQLMVHNFQIKKDHPYTLSFKIRGNKPIFLNAYVAMDAAPWSILGMHTRFQVTKEWKTYKFQFFATESFEKTRFTFTGWKPGTYELAEMTLRPGGNFGLAEDAKLENGTVPTLKKDEMQLSEEFRRDFWAFLVDLEWNYWPEMSRFLKDELKVKAPISGTQLYYGSKHVQAALDYCDDHAYWNHPSWPNKAWDNNDWFIRNRALADCADKDIFTRLGTRRVAGKPHTISEYNHPVPNQYAAEGLPMICAFSRFQGWDGIFQYTYVHQPNEEPDKLTGYFDMIQQVGQLVHSPACANILLRGDVSPAKQTIYGKMSRNEELDAFLKARSPRQIDFESIGLDPRLTLLHGTALDLSELHRSQWVPTAIPADQKVFVSDTGELTWNMERDGKGYFVLKTPKTKVFTGFVKDGFVDLGDGVQLTIGKTRLGWATVTLTEVAPKRWLLAASGFMENTGMKFEKYSDKPDQADRMTLHKNWGTGPVLCEGIPLTLAVPIVVSGKSRAYALDSSGNRTKELGVEYTNSGYTTITCGPQDKTLWYEIVGE